MVRTQISFDDVLFARAKQVAEQKGISQSELCRRAVAEMIAHAPSDKPRMSFAGIITGEPNDSVSVDSGCLWAESDLKPTRRPNSVRMTVR